jgi:hypothetical protein
MDWVYALGGINLMPQEQHGGEKNSDLLRLISQSGLLFDPHQERGHGAMSASGAEH